MPIGLLPALEQWNTHLSSWKTRKSLLTGLWATFDRKILLQKVLKIKQKHFLPGWINTCVR